MTEMDVQEVPEDVVCPECGADPLPNPSHKLSAIGYTHDDVLMTCSDDECQNQWLHGIPIGDSDYGDDLDCDACGGFALPHKIRLEPVLKQLREQTDKKHPDMTDLVLRINMKCTECKHFFQIEREGDKHGTVLVGYPEITGSMDDLEHEYF